MFVFQHQMDYLQNHLINYKLEITITSYDEFNIAEVSSAEVIINNTQDALELLVNCKYNGADAIILRSDNINPEFFNLKTGLAGEILQKFSNYACKLGIVGNFVKYSSNSLVSFIIESNKNGQIVFVKDKSNALNIWKVN